MRYFIIAGEPSGDGHGARLIRGLKKVDADASFQFWGGDQMAQEAGAEALLHHYRKSSYFGIFDVIRNLRNISRQLKKCKEQILASGADVVILIDYPGFNMQIAKWAKLQGIKVFYYIAPKVWASREGRIKQIKKYVDSLFVIFPFEVEYFKSKGVEAHFEGNPTVDAIEEVRAQLPDRETFLQSNTQLDKRPIVALLAGSRKGEVSATLPIMESVAKAYPTYQFVVAGVDWLDYQIYSRYVERGFVKFITNQTYALLSHSEAAIVTSGTATLETALIGTPEVVLYRLARILLIFKPLFLKIPFISLVNINLGRASLREILQSGKNPKDTINALGEILEGGAERGRMLQDFEELKTTIKGAGASDRFAAQIYSQLIENQR